MLSFALHPDTVAEIKSMTPQFRYGVLAKVVLARTYVRGNETWNDIVIRVTNGVFSIRKNHFIRSCLAWDDDNWQGFARALAISMFNLEWMPPGRGLWMMGTDFVNERGSMALNNCGMVTTEHDFVHAADWTMDALMNGVGVGFDTAWRGDVLPPDTEHPFPVTIADSREGWVDSVIRLMCAYVDSPKYGRNPLPQFDYGQIRPMGSPIRGFGGTASGPGPLRQLHERIRSYFSRFLREGEALSNYTHTRLIADVFNAIGACVVAGNVRRSAQMCMGTPEDEVFLHLKDTERCPERQDVAWMSNNSVVFRADMDYRDYQQLPGIAKRIWANGEPGIILLRNIQKYGRHGKKHSDEAFLENPCGEIGGISFELCNVVEQFPANCKTQENFLVSLRYATFYASTVSLLMTHRPETNEVICKNRRIGVAIGGVAQWMSMKGHPVWGDMNNTRMTSHMREGYCLVRQVNKELAQQAGIPESVRVTTIKPSGTISLLAGVPPGIHYPFSRYMVRRMRIAENSPLVPLLREANVPCEPDKCSDNTLVFSFYLDYGDMRSASEVSPWEQFSLVAEVQRCWADNSVSASVTFNKQTTSVEDIERLLAAFIPVVKSVSMFPESDHGFEQAPCTPITADEFARLSATVGDIQLDRLYNNVPSGTRYCTSDACEM